MEFFDADCVIGRRSSVPRWGVWRFDQLLGAMTNYGITRALAYHVIARESDASSGNSLLLEALAKTERLEASYVLEPLEEVGSLANEKLLRQSVIADKMIRQKVIQSGVRAIRLFPHKHGYRGDLLMLGDIFAAAEKIRLPVFYHVEMCPPDRDMTDWLLISEICTAYPRLLFVLMDVGIAGTRALLKILASHKNVMVGMTHLRSWRIIEKINVKYGPEKILFSTGMSEFDPGFAMGMVLGSEIPESHKQMIAAGNLYRLLDGVIV